MKNGLYAIVIGSFLVVTLLASVLIPVISDATKTHETFENESLYYMTEFDEDTSIVYTFDGTSWTIDGEPVDIANSSNMTVVAGSGVILRADGTFYTGSAFHTRSITSLTVTESGMTGTVVNTVGTSQPISFNREIYYAAIGSETDHVLTPYNSTTYVNGDSEIFGDGWTVIGNVGAVYEVAGSIDNGFTATCQNTNMTISNVVCNYDEVDGYIDLYTVTSITFDVVYNGGTPDDDSDDVSGTATYTSYIAPAKVTAELSEHMDSASITLLNVFPVLLIIGLLMAVATIAFFRRED